MTWLSVATLVLAVLLAASWVVLLLAVRALRRRADELHAQVAVLTPPPALSPDLEVAFGTGTRRLLVIEILNAVELATQRAKAAKLLGIVAPEMLRKIVVEQASRDIVVQLAEEGVHAQVTIHAAR